jgi:hypothetical protein
VSGLDHSFFNGQLVECEYRTSPDSNRGNIEHRRRMRILNIEQGILNTEWNAEMYNDR